MSDQQQKPPWVICVFRDSLKMTLRALNDLLVQSVKPHVLAISNGSTLENWEAVRRWARDHRRLWLWNHNPPLPSLAMTWNLALDFVWDRGVVEALVVNHDVQVSSETLAQLSRARRREKALFVSAVGVEPDQFSSGQGDLMAKGGPDFSCFLIAKACHEKYRFDENFTPAYCEDLDYHRRMLLGGDGKKIFSVNVPFAHYASGVLKSLGDDARAKLEREISAGSRAYYERKWGGPVNCERFWAPMMTRDIDSTIADAVMEEIGQPTTPNLHKFYGPL